MSSEVAQTVLVTIATAEAAVWLVGLWFLIGSYRVGKMAPDQANELIPAEGWPKNTLAGTVEVEGQPAALLDKAGSLLLKESGGTLRDVNRAGGHLSFERVGPGRGGLRTRVQLRFTSAGGGRTRIEYALILPDYRWLLWLGGLFQALGLVGLVVGGWVISALCVPSPDPKVRTQAVQMVQAAHFLWPPFLFAGLYRRYRRLAKDEWESLLRALSLFGG